MRFLRGVRGGIGFEGLKKILGRVWLIPFGMFYLYVLVTLVMFGMPFGMFSLV